MARKRKMTALIPPESKPRSVPPTAPRERGSDGKYLGKEAKMMHNTYDAFIEWYNDRKPRILTKGKYEFVKLGRRQRETLQGILESDGKGGFKHGISLMIWPRRHSKSTMLRLVCLWLFDTRDNLTVQCWGNSEAHSRRVQYNTMIKIIENTPALRNRIPEKGISKTEIQHGHKGGRILAMIGGSVVYGDKIDVLYIDDFHHQTDLESINALQAALLDQDDSLMLVGSNVDSIDGHVHAYQKLAKDDPGIFCDHLQYRDWTHYEDEAPKWIDRARAKRMQGTQLPSEFDRDILGKRTQSQNSLFEIEYIQACKSLYTIPVKKGFRELIQGRSCKIGAGLDRAKDMFGSVSGRDNTIWTVVAKVARFDGEPEIFVLDQVKVVPNTAQYIKKLIRDAHDLYRLDNLILEDYQAMDIEPWCLEQNIPVELMTAHSNKQNVMFPELHRIVKEGRLHFPSDMNDLMDEMKAFQYTSMGNGKYSFGAAGKGHDDRVYSLGWSIFSLRKEILANYVLGNIQCVNRNKSRQLCFMVGGDLELSCSRECLAFQQVKDMFREFKKFHTESHLTIGHFYKRHVKVTGAMIYQAV
ncbi:MAG: hypothetical protein WC799_05510 [Desulfobacteraceae bacterium]|jgi:hypothetical protein